MGGYKASFSFLTNKIKGKLACIQKQQNSLLEMRSY